MKKLRVGVIYGGRSGEHEVSIASAAAILRHLDRTRYEAVPIRIEKTGRWSLADKAPTTLSAAEVIEQHRLEAARPTRPLREAHLVAYPSEEAMLTIERSVASAADESSATVTGLGLDVIFPVLHGPYGEDGCIQGLLELANLPYVGAGVLGSAVGMDKAVMKTLFAARGLPIAAHLTFTRPLWARDAAAATARVTELLGYPVFVKPANLGSSVGISKVKAETELAAAVAVAFEFDRKIVIEAAVPRARELECAVLGNDDPQASVVGEVVPSREFYDYEAKYLDNSSKVIIPAVIPPEMAEAVRRLSIEAFAAVDGAGMARVDFLLDGESGLLYLNEVNTLPGFTTISQYPQLWQASGLSYSALVDRLIELALERHADKQQVRTSIT
ncbi:MAG: D-alanine--D-alanine ligase family protein [Vicinamibacterales bacterium]